MFHPPPFVQGLFLLWRYALYSGTYRIQTLLKRWGQVYQDGTALHVAERIQQTS